LAYLLQGLIAAALLAAQQQKPFSHRVHLNLKPDCVACHTRAATSEQAADNLLPEKTACAGCHQDVSIKTPQATLVSRFNHKLHRSLGNIAPVIATAIDRQQYLSLPGDIRRHLSSSNACEACHRGLHESDAVSKLNYPAMADCLVCHSKVDPPFSCTFCHQAGAHLKPASHTSDFLESHSSKKKQQPLDKASCALCHGRTFTCLGCH
jgi:hypothetical protein